MDYSYSSGLLERVIGITKLDRGFHGKRRTTTFSFYINNLLITVSNAQIEIDESYETKKEIIIFEAKKGIPSSFNIRQLYYPYRMFADIKATRLFLFSFDSKKKVYLFWEYAFSQYDRFESIKLVNASKYQIKFRPKKISVKPYLDVIPDSSKINIPQADDINKILLFPLKVSEGYNTSAKIEELFGFVRRQSNYYRQACEILGLIMSSHGIFHLTKKGEEYLKLSADEKSRFIGQLLLEFPIMNEIFLKAIMEHNKAITIDNIVQIIKKDSYLNETTLRRRARTIVSWFKWIRNNLGLIEVDRVGNISSSKYI